MTNPDKILPRVIFLLGAGASVDADLPTVRTLIERFDQRVSKRRSLGRAFELVKSHLQDNFPPLAEGKAILDIELLLETIHLLRDREGSPLSAFVDRWRKNVRNLDKALEELEQELREFVRDECTVDPQKVQYLWLIRDFVQNYGTVDIFTLNYDASIEIVCQQQELRYTDGFDSYWNPAQFDSTRFDLRLFKVHGSLLWYKTSGASTSIVKIPISPRRDQRVRLFTNEDVSELLLYPAFSKEQHVEPYSTLLSRFKDALDSCDLLIAIGCSFRDSYLKQLIIERMRQNPRLQVLVVDPEAAAVLKWSDETLQGDWQFESVRGRLALIHSSAKDAFAQRRLLDSARGVLEVASMEEDYLRLVWSGRTQDATEQARVYWDTVVDTRHIGRFLRVLSDDPGELGGEFVRQTIRVKDESERIRLYVPALLAARFAPSQTEKRLIRDWVVASTNDLLRQLVWKEGSTYYTNAAIDSRSDAGQFFESRRDRLRSVNSIIQAWAKPVALHSPGIANDYVALTSDFAKAQEYFEDAVASNRYTAFSSWPARDNSFPRSVNDPLMEELGTRFDNSNRLPRSLISLLNLT